MRTGAAELKDSRAILESFELLRGVRSETVSKLLQTGVTRHYPEDTYIIARDDDSQSLLFVLSGRISIERMVDDRVIALLQRATGEVVGEISCITGDLRSADVRSVTEANILQVRAQTVHELFQSDPAFSMNMMKLLAYKLRQTVDASASGGQKLSQKLALEIYSEFKSDREKVGADRWVLRRKITQVEWANRIGARRESVNRVFKQLFEDKILSLHRGRLCLVDRERLVELAQH